MYPTLSNCRLVSPSPNPYTFIVHFRLQPLIFLLSHCLRTPYISSPLIRPFWPMCSSSLAMWESLATLFTNLSLHPSARFGCAIGYVAMQSKVYYMSVWFLDLIFLCFVATRLQTGPQFLSLSKQQEHCFSIIGEKRCYIHLQMCIGRIAPDPSKKSWWLLGKIWIYRSCNAYICLPHQDLFTYFPWGTENTMVSFLPNVTDGKSMRWPLHSRGLLSERDGVGVHGMGLIPFLLLYTQYTRIILDICMYMMYSLREIRKGRCRGPHDSEIRLVSCMCLVLNYYTFWQTHAPPTRPHAFSFHFQIWICYIFRTVQKKSVCIFLFLATRAFKQGQSWLSFDQVYFFPQVSNIETWYL